MGGFDDEKPLLRDGRQIPSTGRYELLNLEGWFEKGVEIVIWGRWYRRCLISAVFKSSGIIE